MQPIIVSAAPSKEELRGAYERLRKAVAEEPQVTGHWLLLADICLHLGRKEEAKALLVKTIERDPRSRAAVQELLQGHLSPSELARLPLGKERVPFYEDAASILRYPLRGNGPVLLIGGGIVFTGLVMLARLTSIFFWIPTILTAGYLSFYMITIIENSARGQSDPPDYPDFANFWDSVLGPLLIVLSASFIPASLVVAYILLWGANVGVAPFLAVGLVYSPMALLAGAILQNALAPLNVLRVVRAIRASGKEYYLVVAVISGLAFVSYLGSLLFTKLHLPTLAAELIVQTLSLYFLLAEMHILGRIYLNHEREIGWFGGNERQ